VRDHGPILRRAQPDDALGIAEVHVQSWQSQQCVRRQSSAGSQNAAGARSRTASPLLICPPTGFRVLFTAMWLHHRPGGPIPNAGAPTSWSVVTARSELEEWNRQHDAALISACLPSAPPSISSPGRAGARTPRHLKPARHRVAHSPRLARQRTHRSRQRRTRRRKLRPNPYRSRH
jgi:hypothetical protein